MPAYQPREEGFPYSGSVYKNPGRITVADAVRTSPTSLSGSGPFFMHMSPSVCHS